MDVRIIIDNPSLCAKFEGNWSNSSEVINRILFDLDPFLKGEPQIRKYIL